MEQQRTAFDTSQEKTHDFHPLIPIFLLIMILGGTLYYLACDLLFETSFHYGYDDDLWTSDPSRPCISEFCYQSTAWLSIWKVWPCNMLLLSCFSLFDPQFLQSLNSWWQNQPIGSQCLLELDSYLQFNSVGWVIILFLSVLKFKVGFITFQSSAFSLEFERWKGVSRFEKKMTVRTWFKEKDEDFCETALPVLFSMLQITSHFTSSALKIHLMHQFLNPASYYRRNGMLFWITSSRKELICWIGNLFSSMA